MMENRPKNQKVGVIGLGSMGMGSALALCDQGFDVLGYDVSAVALQKFTEGGGRAMNSPAAVAAEADLIFVVVVNADQVETVLFGSEAVTNTLAKGGLVIQCATVAPSFARSLGVRLQEKGLELLDAPISGGSIKARQGKLSMMASGRPENFVKASDILDVVAEKVYQLGDVPGIGSSMKLVNQLLAGVHIAAAGEAMALGLSMGLDADTIYDVITHSAGNSWMFENRVPHIIAGDYTPHSAVDIFVKDLGIVHATGKELPLSMPVASAALQQFTAASAAGHGREDDSAVVKVYEHLSKLRLPASSKS